MYTLTTKWTKTRAVRCLSSLPIKCKIWVILHSDRIICSSNTCICNTTYKYIYIQALKHVLVCMFFREMNWVLVFAGVQCESMAKVEIKLQEMDIKYVKTRVEEGGIHVDQLFFHDPDGLMIEICNCDNLPVIPLTGDSVQSCSRISCNVKQHQHQIQQVVKINQL